MKNFIKILTIFIAFSAIISESSFKKSFLKSTILAQTNLKQNQYCIPKPTCIPKPICQPQVNCIPRPVALPNCEELPPQTNPQPIIENINQNYQQNQLPYCEYKRYCQPEQPQIPYCPEPTPEPPVTIPPVIVPPKIIKCGLLSTCCWEGLNLLPESFWLNQDKTAGRDFIAIGNENKYLSADEEGKITISANVGDAELFRVNKIAGGIVTIESFYGGYLSINEDGTVDAKSRVVCEDNYIHIVYSKNNCDQDEINYVAFRAINGYYLSILDNEVAAVDKLTATTELFKGYLFDESSSKCDGQEPQPEPIPEPEPQPIVEPKPQPQPEPEIINGNGEEITTVAPSPITIPKECLDLTDKIISIECKVILDKIQEAANVSLQRKRRRRRN